MPPIPAPRIAVLGAVIAAVTMAQALEPLPQDRGATGAWQKLLKLRTTASVLHTTAHPDDEHGGVLAMLSRGEGARVALLTLTRGESGDNAIGPELFDALGLIRTEELLRADQYYGVDQQYFTSVIDYGFSKRLEETLVKWGRENVLRDVVRVIRTERPLVVIARFQGNERDGHGNHQAAGLITREAYDAAGDSARFPEQLQEGIRPWQPLKLYMGGVRQDEDWTIRVDPAVYSPWLGDSYANFARIGLSFQRSQNSGRVDLQPGPAWAYYKRLASQVGAPPRENSFFDGIDTSLAGIFTTLHHAPPPDAATVLGAIESEIDAAVRAFRLEDPSLAAPPLARGLAATRRAIERFSSDADVRRLLETKQQQFVDAINAALGIEFTAVAGLSGPAADMTARPEMNPAAPGQTFEASIRLTNRGSVEIAVDSIEVSGAGGSLPAPARLARDRTLDRTIAVAVPRDARMTRPYFARASILDTRYNISDARVRDRPASAPAFVATAAYRVNGTPVQATVPVMRREAQLPFGHVMRELAVVPAIAVAISPRQAIVPRVLATTRLPIEVELTANAVIGDGRLGLELPAGWTAAPSSTNVAFARAGEKSRYVFDVSVPALADRDYTIAAVATAGGQTFREGYDVIAHRDLETRYLYREATTRVRGIDVKMVPGLKVGYVMGVGDEVPSGMAQLGAQVQRLGAADLAGADLRQFDAIVTGTRAYAVRDDLKTYNRRLLEYVRNGGNLIVLYNTPAEFDPNVFAPYPASLPRTAEEVSEEDSPVTILAPGRPEFTTPNAITRADFDGWVEQRGSKFFSDWDPAYTPMIETHDQGQAPQRGGWLTARYGKGHYTYFAYAFHRQLPYGVPGAYRLLANLLSLARE